MKTYVRSLAQATLVATITLLHGTAIAQQDGKDFTPPPSDEAAETSSGTPRASSAPTSRIYPGDAAPDFSLDGSPGKSVKLSSLRGDWVALVFSDRANPIPTLQPIDHDLRLLGVRLVAVCRERVSRVRSLSSREKLSFLTLADEMGQIGALYGLRDGTRAETRPAFLLLDRRGTVKLSVMGQALPADQILQLTRGTVVGGS